jgi:hypothetical protein
LSTTPAGSRFGADFANVSQRVPAALIGIGRPGGWAFHTDEGAEQFARDGEERLLSIAQVLALTSFRLLQPMGEFAVSSPSAGGSEVNAT